MSQLDPRVPKLEALLEKVMARAAEPRVRVTTAAVAPAPVPVAPAAPPMAAPPAVAAEPARVEARTPAQTLVGPPSRRSHGALPAVSAPVKTPSSIPAPAPADAEPVTPVPEAAAASSGMGGLSSVRIDADPSVDALLAHPEDHDDPTIQASVPIRAPAPPVAAPPPRAPSAPPAAAAPPAPRSAPRAIEAAPEPEEERHLTPPPESGKQRASVAPLSARKADIPSLAPEGDGDDGDGATLVGVGRGAAAVAAKVTGSVVPEASPAKAPQGPSVYTPSLPTATVSATVERSVAAAGPQTLGGVLDDALGL
jgi:hypothetical protein